MLGHNQYLSKKMMSGKELTPSEKTLFDGIKSKTQISKNFGTRQTSTRNDELFQDQKDNIYSITIAILAFTNIVSKPTLAIKNIFLFVG